MRVAEPARGRRWARLAAAAALLLAAPVGGWALGAAREAKPLDLDAFYPEGPAVIGDALYWAEMPTNRVQRYSHGRVETVWQQKDCGPTAVRPTPGGDIWILCHLADEVVLVGPDWRTKRTFTIDQDGNRLTRPNDGKVDRDGTLYFSSSGEFSVGAPSTGYVVSLRLDGVAQRISGPYHYTNGIAISPDGTRLFVSEHLERRIWELRLAGGRVASRRIFFDFAAAGLDRPGYREAGPDGQWLSPTGKLLVPEYGGGRIIRISRDGKLEGTVKVKTRFVTNLVPSPFHKGKLIVTGTYDNSEPALRGSVFEIPLPQ